MKSKLIAAAVLLFATALVLLLVLKPKDEPAPVPDKPHLVKQPMLKAPPRELFAAPVTPPPPPVTPPPLADASVQAPQLPPALSDPNPVARPLNGVMNHHPPPPHSAGSRFLALERRYDRAKQAWTQLRSHKSAEEQQKYDALLQQAGAELSSGSRQAGAGHLQEFITQAMDGVEP